MDQEGLVLKDRYMLLERIGEGGMGEVFRALDQRTGQDVAVKMLHAKLCEREQSRKRFAREAQAARMLHHPGIVRVIEFGEYRHQPFIVMELLTGLSLRKFIRRHKPSPEELLGLMVELCDALYHAHCRGVIHRDLKPDNIFVNHLHHIKVLDFGLARLSFNPDLTALTRSGTALGTCSYMAPEQATGKEADQRSDLYALGVILYEFFCGLTPFSADDPTTVLYMQVHQEPERPCEVNPELPLEIEALILWLMNKNPRYRPATALALKEKLVQIIRLLHVGAVHYLQAESPAPPSRESDPLESASATPLPAAPLPPAPTELPLEPPTLGDNSDLLPRALSTPPPPLPASEPPEPPAARPRPAPALGTRTKAKLQRPSAIVSVPESLFLPIEDPTPPRPQPLHRRQPQNTASEAPKVTVLVMRVSSLAGLFPECSPLDLMELTDSVYQIMEEAALGNGGVCLVKADNSLKVAFFDEGAGLRAIQTAIRARMGLRHLHKQQNLRSVPPLSAGIYTDRLHPRLVRGPFNADTLREVLSGATRLESLARVYPNETFVCADSLDRQRVRAQAVRTIYLRNRPAAVYIYRVAGLL